MYASFVGTVRCYNLSEAKKLTFMIHKSICYKQALVLIVRLYAVIQHSILNGDTVFRLDP